MITHATRSPARALLLSGVAALLLFRSGPVAGRPGEGEKPVGVRLGREFSLRAGQRAAAEGLRVRFVSVASDSRCPAGVTCVWAGNAEVLVEAEDGGSRAVLRLNTHGGADLPKVGRHRRFSVELIALSPRPREGSRVKAANYVATLVIRKA